MTGGFNAGALSSTEILRYEEALIPTDASQRNLPGKPAWEISGPLPSGGALFLKGATLNNRMIVTG